MLQLSAGCQLRVQPGPALSGVPGRRVACLERLSCSPPPYGELDVAALVLAVSDGPAPAGSQTVQLADRTGALLSALCRPGLQVSTATAGLGLTAPGRCCPPSAGPDCR